MKEEAEAATTKDAFEWTDDLIWCPSQCYADVRWPDGTPAVLYLRWRHGDPWTGSVITGKHQSDPHYYEGEWTDLDIGYWRDVELDEAKGALIAAWAAVAAGSEQ